MTKSAITFHPTNPKELCDERLGEIYQIEQDMWAREQGLGEYLKCSSCESVFSKQDIYGGLDRKTYELTVSELEQREQRDIFCCTSCGGKLNHSFSKEEYMDEIRDRYTSKATLVLMQEDEQLIGFMDGYVDDIDTIYNRELSEHYASIGIEEVKAMVRTSLNGVMPSEFFSCSSSGTKEKYMNMIHIYNLLRNFFENFPEEMKSVTALSELHAGGPYTRIFSALGARTTGIRDRFKHNISTTDAYKSDIYVHENFGESCKRAFTGKTRKEFMNSIR